LTLFLPYNAKTCLLGIVYFIKNGGAEAFHFISKLLNQQGSKQDGFDRIA